MLHLKSFAISICAATLMFGILKNVLPGVRYQKYMKTILILIFVILSVNGIRNAVFYQDIRFDDIGVETGEISLEDQLNLRIKEYLNIQLKDSAYEAECTDVKVVAKENDYYISEISVVTESDEAIEFLKEITGLQEEQIRVGV